MSFADDSVLAATEAVAAGPPACDFELLNRDHFFAAGGAGGGASRSASFFCNGMAL